MGKLQGMLDPWDPAELERIHQASLALLEMVGVALDSDEALDALATSGARVDRDARTARFPAAMVQERMLNAPGCWDRGPGVPNGFSVSADCGAYNIWDYGTRRARPTTIRDFSDAPRLVQALKNIDAAGNLVSC